VFTNGVFDILHTGHFELLAEAKSLGDKLVVGINSDASVKRLKGEDRPINNAVKRVRQLEILPWVDRVVLFSDDTPYELIKKLKPNIIVKGGDYTVEQVVGHDLADVHLVPTVEGYSTTQIIEASR
jgi:D-beta-D-heptose 7-phosphate kinase/D-beta-D-heptose 1-phosphate adenosyltransferase